MPANDPGAYQNMSTDQLVDMIEQEVAAMEAGEEPPAAEMPPGELPEDVAMEADAEKALAEAESPIDQDVDVEAALEGIMAGGAANAAQVLDQLRAQGFEIVRVGGMNQEIPEGPPQELPMRDARRMAAERAVGGAA